MGGQSTVCCYATLSVILSFTAPRFVSVSLPRARTFSHDMRADVYGAVCPSRLSNATMKCVFGLLLSPVLH